MSRKKQMKDTRTALSPRNILEFEAGECARIKRQNKSLGTRALKTRPELLNKIIFVAKEKH